METIRRRESGLDANDMDSDEEDLNENFDSDEADNKSDDDNTTASDSSGNKAGNKKDNSTDGDKYLAPVEVEAQIKLLWEQHPELLNYIWTRALSTNSSNNIDLKAYPGWKVFFMRVITVTPNRFRPASVVGEAMSEHPQNIHLKKIIELNSAIRLLQAKAGGNFSQLPEELTEADLLALEDPDQKALDLSKLISSWIELQDSVNTYMDSSKHPNAANPEFSLVGIKQILERKEGLFRRHMMGKRVNFCCRSVISPDPYLGTNEIGIPVRFAKELHYPTPVNDWNVKYLRKLVERGPDQYPGKYSADPCSVFG